MYLRISKRRLAQVHIIIDFRKIWVVIVMGILMMTASGIGMEARVEQWWGNGWGIWAGKAGRLRYESEKARNWQVTLVRSLMMGALWELSGRVGWSGWQWVPWLVPLVEPAKAGFVGNAAVGPADLPGIGCLDGTEPAVDSG